MMQNPHLAPCETIIHDLRAFRQHGVFRTAQVLHLEYGKLKRLAGAAATQQAAGRAANRVSGVDVTVGNRSVGVCD